jgi:hypothetical protein
VPGTRINTGSDVLASSVAEDWALVRLRSPAPAGATFSAWNAAPITSGAVIDLHHPAGDYKKYSAGTISGLAQVRAPNEHTGEPEVNAMLIDVRWQTGVTEGGSSGSGLLTLAAAGHYEVRGGLEGGGSSCHSNGKPDHFSRLDRMLPLTRDYLAPGTGPTGQVVVVEYYNKTLKHYFMTANAAEIAGLDNGTFAGWVRTGLRFLAHADAAAGTSPVCRFYREPAAGDSHFYSASPAECDSVRGDPVRFPGWIYESAAVFHIALPDQASGTCPAGTAPLSRFFNKTTSNHRYTADVSVRELLRQKPAEWIPEGYGPDAVVMCAIDGG